MSIIKHQSLISGLSYTSKTTALYCLQGVERNHARIVYLKAWDENGEGMYTRDGVRVDLFFPNLRNFWYFHQKRGRREEENVSCDNDARSWLLRMNCPGRGKREKIRQWQKGFWHVFKEPNRCFDLRELSRKVDCKQKRRQEQRPFANSRSLLCSHQYPTKVFICGAADRSGRGKRSSSSSSCCCGGPFFKFPCTLFWGVKRQQLCLKRGGKRQKLS